MASRAVVPAAIACWARLDAVSGAPSMMLCRMAEKVSSGMMSLPVMLPRQAPAVCDCDHIALVCFRTGEGFRRDLSCLTRDWSATGYPIPGISTCADWSFILTSFAVAATATGRNSLENPGLHEAGAAERRAAEVERVGDMDPRRRFL